jgi:hypothetical protein
MDSPYQYQSEVYMRVPKIAYYKNGDGSLDLSASVRGKIYSHRYWGCNKREAREWFLESLAEWINKEGLYAKHTRG